ncbi:phage holin family protein [Egibacter rhizosphaerae]|uniref:Phage holin family protein n=1 Tax=Egibacter rhizosphaerae TaxID=1670831 RepID=A0A411YF43_9ACTN|nr:phage holin family protein [Egibacter rhizosphaerae]QBI19801.1 phage holin family protein [Egibacter rhizosphaerae]
MRAFLLRAIVNGVAIWIATLLVPGVEIGGTEATDQAITIALVAVLFGVVNAVLGPILRTLTFPLVLLTFGLFTFVVNALLLWFSAWLGGVLGLDFTVDGFLAALLGSLVVTIVSVALSAATRG